MNELPAALQFGSFGLLSVVLWWVGKYMVDRFSSRFDQLESKTEELRDSNVELGKTLLLVLVKLQHPGVDVSDEAKRLLHDDDKEK